jgi:hypothetical protein
VEKAGYCLARPYPAGTYCGKSQSYQTKSAGVGGCNPYFIPRINSCEVVEDDKDKK